MRKVLFILGELLDADLDWLVEAGRRVKIAQGEALIREGESSDHLFIVLDGQFGVTSGGRELARLAAGEIVGEMSLLDSRPPNATVTALEESFVYSVAQRALRTKLSSDAGFAAHFYRAVSLFLADRLRRSVVLSGGGAEAAHDVKTADDDELSPELMDNLSLAGTRYTWFMNRVRER